MRQGNILLEYGLRPGTGCATRFRRWASQGSRQRGRSGPCFTRSNAEGSKFVQAVSLSAGDPGDRVEFGNAIDWRTLSANLKVSFPLAASNENAAYNWGVGTIERSNANERQFEVASHRWIDLTDKSDSFGTTILTDCKNGSDKPNDNTLRVTLLRSPGMRPQSNGRPPSYGDQANRDWGSAESSVNRPSIPISMTLRLPTSHCRTASLSSPGKIGTTLNGRMFGSIAAILRCLPRSKEVSERRRCNGKEAFRYGWITDSLPIDSRDHESIDCQDKEDQASIGVGLELCALAGCPLTRRAAYWNDSWKPR